MTNFTTIKEALLKAEEEIAAHVGNYFGDNQDTLLRAGNLVVLGAYESMKKTTLMLSMAKEFAVENDIPIAYISTSITTTELAIRLHSIVCGFDVAVRGEFLSQNISRQIKLGEKILSNAPVFLNTTSGNIEELMNSIKTVVKENGVKYVFVENINQLFCFVGHKYDSRNEEELAILRNLRFLAQELGICIIAAYRLNQPKRRTKPMIEDLPFGKHVFDHASVMLMFRPEYFGIYEDKQGNDLHGMAYLSIFNRCKPREVVLTLDNYTRFLTLKGRFPYLPPSSTKGCANGKLAVELFNKIVENNPTVELLMDKFDLELY